MHLCKHSIRNFPEQFRDEITEKAEAGREWVRHESIGVYPVILAGLVISGDKKLLFIQLKCERKCDILTKENVKKQ